MELAEYDFRIEFVPGWLNDVADALSRLMVEEPNDKENSIEFRDYLRDFEVSYESVETMFASDEFVVDWDVASDSLHSLGEEDDHITKCLEGIRALCPLSVDGGLLATMRYFPSGYLGQTPMATLVVTALCTLCARQCACQRDSTPMVGRERPD